MSGFRQGILVAFIATTLCRAFTVMPSLGTSRHTPTSTSQLYQATAPVAPVADFEYQELKAQLEVMSDREMATRDLQSETLETLEGYVKTIVEKRPSLISLPDIGKVLPGSSWKMVFSTQDAVLGDLPEGTSVQINFYNESDFATDPVASLPGLTDTGGVLDYVLQFPKTALAGVSKLTAKSNYTVADSEEYINPGMVAFSYQDVKSDAFGVNIGLGWLGFVKGRTVYVNTAFIDGQFWIESGENPDGKTYYSVYVRQ
uniref:Plastid lipid-associated protein/fibrillin conserved domain-containing protein n=1 Tax=Grammatophora oceanica TaxID=210454 RepID=A0A7S1Y0Z8_9STRA|mmetsp:Transcript_13506/g.19850  ORF Transcript_13506/g.19850 Transcript_13506/m.19850 type:complete len:258 (+) Transcript_13506:159-932(+)|eukprot:CAMPEP_0194026710 /NCGR_PEP_ID=MMETSP0009_2-20130614/1013_1 /TAXON_ID=210454 /ORGANISM="Grammatophora oceanica, Strain CCMP 410" /LENGTH=257 /DNA_ID=CAMNT_0038665553 /DNA_START=159 /DNA_END=932 /DNA_ORIENTATION=+